MATNKQARRANQAASDAAAQAGEPSDSAGDSEMAPDSVSDEPDMVVVNVPRAFTLLLNDGKSVAVKPGVQNMLTEYATHWYSVASGVVVVGQV